LAEDPDRFATYAGAAEFALRTGDVGAAAGLGAAGLELRPGDPELLLLRGRALLLAGRADSSAAALEAGLRARPDDPEARADLARALYDLGRPDEAMAAFRESLRGDPQSVPALLDAALVLHETGTERGDAALRAAAVELLERALALDPELPDARARLAEWGASSKSP
jgi:tetratricopeptide (TPR) repeat protein